MHQAPVLNRDPTDHWPCTYFLYFTYLTEFFSIFVIRYGKSKNEEKATRYPDNE